MAKFDLLQQLQNPKTDDKTPLPKGVKYDQHEVVLEGETVLVYIPRRESEKFLEKVEEKPEMTRHNFNALLREVRGIRG